MKIFLWKATQNAVAAEANLAAHHIPCLPRCVLCGHHNANTNHVLFFCQAIKKAWNETPWWPVIKKSKGISEDSLTSHFILSLTEPALEQVAMKMWGIWKERCDWTHSTGGSRPGKMIQANWTETFLHQFQYERAKLTANENAATSTTYTNQLNYGRDTDILKVDAAYNEATMSFAIGFFILDKDGTPRAAGFHKINPPGSVLAAEVKAISDGLQFWRSISQEPVMILSDSKEAINAIYSDSQFKGYEESSIIMARSLIRNSPVTGVRFCPRSHNKEAHTLAQIATKSPLPQAWVGEDIPRHILSLAQDYTSNYT